MTTLQNNWRDLIKPRGLVAENATLTASYGKFTAEPLERGYASTLGNSLRRILLSSLQGFAITRVKVEGVLHEFTTIPEVHEDMVDKVLNLKQVVLRGFGEGPYALRVKVKGESIVTAADIECPTGIEVVNSDLVLAHVGKGGLLEMTLTAETGRGFVMAEQNKSPDQLIGEVAIDALFSPVRKVNFQVGQARVGQMTNYDKLVLEIWTDGTVAPDDAISIAGRILQDQLSVFVNFEADAERDDTVAPVRGGTEVDEQFLVPVEELEMLSDRTKGSLKSSGVNSLGDLIQLTETELKAIKGVGPTAQEEVKGLLKSMGLTLGSKIPGWESLA